MTDTAMFLKGVSYPPIPVLSYAIPRVISRAVIQNDPFPVLVALLQNALYSLLNIGGLIIYTGQNTYKRFSLHTGFFVNYTNISISGNITYLTT